MEKYSQTQLDKILDDLLEQISLYSVTLRSNTQPFIRKKLEASFPDYQFNYDNHLIRESLLEHTGSLPIIASFLYPYIEEPVNLGKALIMLSFHDIAEIIHGDHITFTKTEEIKQYEKETTLRIIHPIYIDTYLEFESLETNEAKFAKSIDKIAPDLLDFFSGEEYTKDRLYTQLGWPRDEVIQKIRDKKRPFMIWSSFLTGIHDTLYLRYSEKTQP